MARKIYLAVVCAAGFVVSAGETKAAFISTLFAADNGGFIGGAVYFDVTVLNPNGITVQGLSLNTTSNVITVNLDIYVRSGTSQGFESSISGWTLVSSGSGVGAGLDNPTAMNITDFFIAAGTTGIALDAANFSHRYTNGTGSNQTYANADLQLQFGSASNVAFSNSSGVFTPRVWNGTIEYVEGAGPSPSAVPEPASLLSCGIGAIVAAAAARRRRAKLGVSAV